MTTPHPLANVKVYAVQNREGKFFRRKGYGGGGDSWTDDIGKVRIYTKSGPARSIVTFYAKNYPEYGVPSIVEMNCGSNVTVIDETERLVKEARKQHLKRAEHAAKLAKWQQQIDAAGPRPR